MPDSHDYLLINELARHSGWAHAPAVEYANYGVALFALLGLGAFGWAWWHRDGCALVAAAWAGLAGLVALAVNQAPVHLFHEARPYAVMPKALVLVSRSGDPSAPSDHAVLVAAVATGLWLVHRRLGVLAWGLALLMAFDRVYVGAHYPSDVVLGLAEGSLVAVLGAFLAGPLLNVTRVRLLRSPLAGLVERPGTAGR